MVGHLKFCLTVLGGVLLFEDPLHFNQGIGILLTVMGITAYAHVKVSLYLILINVFCIIFDFDYFIF